MYFVCCYCPGWCIPENNCNVVIWHVDDMSRGYQQSLVLALMMTSVLPLGIYHCKGYLHQHDHTRQTCWIYSWVQIFLEDFSMMLKNWNNYCTSLKTFSQNVVSCRINVLSVACGMEHTLVLCSDGVRLFTNLFTSKRAWF